MSARVIGRYEVIGDRSYDEHPPGEIFEARIGQHAEARAIDRGSIRLITRIIDDLIPGSYRLPLAWPTQAAQKGSELGDG